MIKSMIKGALLAGLIVFVWHFISWVALPWHKHSMHKFTNEQYVASVLKANAPVHGIYALPCMQHDPSHPQHMALIKSGPFVFASIYPEGVDMHSKKMLVIGLLTQMLAGAVVGAILYLSCCTNYWKKVRIVLLLCVFTGFVAYVPSWNWLLFPAKYTLIMWADLLIGWFIASLALAAVVKPCKGSSQ